MEELRGKRYADMLLELGRQDLAEAIKTAGGPGAADTRLHLDLAGRDPDEGTTGIAYEKGSAFLQTIESVVGRPRLDAFLREYFEHFQFQPMTSEQLVAYMRQHLLADDEAARINVQAWIYEPGLPSNIPPVHSEAFADVDRRIEAWRTGTAPRSLGTTGWSSHEWLHFLRGLPEVIDPARLAELDRTFSLSTTGNSELMFAWLEIAVRNHYEPAFPALERFLTSQGRRKFLRPLYTALAATGWGEAIAVRIYKKARPTYHSVSVNAIDQVLNHPRPPRG